MKKKNDYSKKKITTIIIIILILLLLFIPRVETLKDGGSKRYKALAYEITKYNMLSEDPNTDYISGYKIKLFGITLKDKKISNFTIYINDGLSLKIKDNTLTKTTATLVIKNEGKNSYTYGKDYAFLKQKDGAWEELETVYGGMISWTLEEKVIGPGEEIEQDINWENIYGSLEKGSYQIVKMVYKTEADLENTNENDIIQLISQFEIKKRTFSSFFI